MDKIDANSSYRIPQHKVTQEYVIKKAVLSAGLLLRQAEKKRFNWLISPEPQSCGLNQQIDCDQAASDIGLFMVSCGPLPEVEYTDYINYFPSGNNSLSTEAKDYGDGYYCLACAAPDDKF